MGPTIVGSHAFKYNYGPINNTELDPIDLNTIEVTIEYAYWDAHHELWGITWDDILFVRLTFECVGDSRRRS